MKIFLDPGHGGDDNGAFWWGYKEKNINLNISLFLWRALWFRGYEVKLSRSSDMAVPLADRCQLANDWGADLFVSIHCDAYDALTPSGMTVHIYEFTEISGPLGHAIVEALRRHFPDPRQRGLRYSNFKVLRETNCPAALVECEFLSNQKQAQWLGTLEAQYGLAEAFAAGILAYENARQRRSA